MSVGGDLNASHRHAPRVRAYAQGEHGVCIYDRENQQAWLACEYAVSVTDWR